MSDRDKDITESRGADKNGEPAPFAGYPAGTQIGSFVIRQLLGEGGFGLVYEAEQSSPVRRRVALKVIKPGMDSKAVIARFEAERQALAMMDHPGVAKVFDGGSTADGRPYFAMELVRGSSITDHCDRHRVDVRQRIELFVRVCDAVQHAHHKGVIHRDLKPGNVLVEYREGTAFPKVIDFGVAKAIHQRLTDETIFTVQGQLIGTPAYMSPEQAEMGAQDIDTRSDVYSLGAVLYEMLTGARPFESETLRNAGLSDIQRVLRDVDPPRPSTRLGSLLTAADRDRVNRILEGRRTAADALRHILERDLDWIVMRCLEKDRERRYDTVEALATDLRRYLRDEPVLARPPARSYRIRKFVRRNRGAVAATAAIAVILVLAVVGVSWQAVRATRARAVAARERDDARVANRRAEEVKAFLTGMLRSANPAASGGAETTLRDVLDRAAREIEDEPFDDRAVEAELQYVIGETYGWLGAYDEALPHLRKSMAVHEEISDPHDDGFGRTALALGHFTLQAGEAVEAERAIRAHLERIADRPSKLYANLLSTHARALRALDRPDEAAASLRAAIEVYESLGDMRFSYTQALTQLALTLQETGEGDTSIGMVEDAVARYASEDDRPDTQYREAYLIETLGILRGRAGDVEGAERDFRRSLEIRRTLYPDAGHPDMVRTLTRLGDAVRSRGRADEAERILREAVDIDRRLHGDAGPAVNHEARIAHAEALIDLERRDEAETALVASSDALAERPNGAHADARDRSLRALAALYDGWPGRTPAPRIADRVEQGRAAGPR